jgi:hypothetical protein
MDNVSTQKRHGPCSDAISHELIVQILRNREIDAVELDIALMFARTPNV